MKIAWLVRREAEDDEEIVFTEPERWYASVRRIVYAFIEES